MSNKFILNYSDKVIFWGILILMALSPVIYSTSADNMFRVPKEVFARVVIAGIVTVWLIKIVELFFKKYDDLGSDTKFLSYIYNYLLSNYKKLIKFPFFIQGILLLIVSLISLANSSVAGTSIKNILNILLYFLFYLIAVVTIKEKHQVEKIITVTLITAVFNSLYCLSQYFGHDPLFYPLNPADKGSSITAAFMDNPNILAGYLAVFIPISLYRLISSNRWIKKIIYLSALITLLTGIIFTGNRTSLLSSTIAMIILTVGLYITIYRYKINKWLKVFYGTAAVIFLSLFFYAAYKKRVIHGLIHISESVEGLSNDRVLYWRTTWEMIKDYPVVGMGIGTFKLHYIKYRTRTLSNMIYIGAFERAEQAHNDYLQLWAETGIFGFLTGLSIIIYYFFMVYRLVKRSRGDEETVGFILSLAASIVTILIYAITCFPFHIVPTSLLFIFLVAAVTAIYRQHNDPILYKTT